MTPATALKAPRDKTQSIKTARRHALELRDKNLQAVHLLENTLNIALQWEPGSPDWQRASKLVAERKYRKSLDALEGLVVARMFELTKMNMSQTGKSFNDMTEELQCLTNIIGYKLRKHIAKALQARSQAVLSALDRYNKAAEMLSPPRPSLKWQDIVEYAFLADFDLLRDSHNDIQTRTWATPAGRLAMDLHFKMECAHEEIA